MSAVCPLTLYYSLKCSSVLLHHLLTETAPNRKLLSPSQKCLLGFNLEIPFKFISWQSSRKMAKRQRNCWKAWCLKQKSIKVSCDLSQTLQMLDTRQSPIYFFFASTFTSPAHDQRFSQMDDVWVAAFLSRSLYLNWPKGSRFWLGGS